MSRIYFAVLLLVAVAYAADDDCDCQYESGEDEKMWKYLKQLSVDVPEEDRIVYSVIPGVLSPLVTCNCDENNREKRKVDSEEIPIPESAEKEPEDTEFRHKLLNTNVHKRNCPRGHRRFGFICVLEADLLQ